MGVEAVPPNVCASALNCSAHTLHHVAECNVLQKITLQNRLQNSKGGRFIHHSMRAQKVDAIYNTKYLDSDSEFRNAKYLENSWLNEG